MVSTFTPNIQLEEPARGDQVGVWDTPVNGNMTLIDLVAGAITTISLNNSPVVLSAAQFKSKTIVFNSTLTGSVAITFPTSFTKSYEIQNVCTGSSAFVITLTTTAAGSQIIGCKPGEIFEVINSAGSILYKNLGHVGSYWDYAGSSVPNWVSACSIPPYLNCDGTAFSSATFPALAVILGGTTLPDSRGRFRAALNQTTGRITSAVSGVDGNTLFSAGSSQSITIGSSHIPAHSHPVSDPGHVHGIGDQVIQGSAGGGATRGGPNNLVLSQSALTGLTVSNSTYANAGLPIIPPAYIGGITMIRSA